MSTHVVDKSIEFTEIEQKMKNILNSGFNLNLRCQYEAFALKLEFSKIFVEVRQLIEDYHDQEFPDIYEHLKMIRTVNKTFQDWMMLNVGNVSGIDVFNKIRSPNAKSTPGRNEDNKKFKNSQTNFATPHLREHEGTYRAVKHFHNTLNQLQQLPCTSYGSSKLGSSNMKPKFNISRTQLPRRRMNFSKSFVNETQ